MNIEQLNDILGWDNAKLNAAVRYKNTEVAKAVAAAVTPDPMQFNSVGHVPVANDWMQVTDSVFIYEVFDNGTLIIRCQNIAVFNRKVAEDMDGAIQMAEQWKKAAIQCMLHPLTAKPLDDATVNITNVITQG